MRWLRRLLGILVLVGVWYFGWQFAGENQESVQIHYVAGELPPFPLWQVVLASFAAGAVLVAAFASFGRAKAGLAARRYRKAIGGLEAEIHQLRNLPLAPEADAPTGDASRKGPLPDAAVGASD